MRLILLSTIIFFSLACKKSSKPYLTLSGVYVEHNPAASGGPTQLNFIGDDRVIVTGGTLNNQYWTSGSDSFDLVATATQLFFVNPANSSQKAEYWYRLSDADGAPSLTLSPCAPGLFCGLDYEFVKVP